MRRFLVIGGVVVLIAILAGLFIGMRGEGGFKRMLTLSGIYSVNMPDGVRCYVNRDGGAIHCIEPNWCLEKDK